MALPAVTPRSDGEVIRTARTLRSIVTSRDAGVIRNAISATGDFVSQGDANSLALAAWLLDSLGRAVRELAIERGANAAELP